MKIKILLLFLLSTSSVVAQNSASVEGRVTGSSGEPIGFVNVTLKGLPNGSVTNEKGEFRIGGLAAGTYTLVASFVGLETHEQRFRASENETVTLRDIQLNELSRELSSIEVSAERDRYKADAPSQSLRLNAPLIEVPQNIQVVTAGMLKDQQAISMSDGLIRNVSGAVRLEHWGDLYTNISARGSQLQAFRNGFNVVNSSWGPLTEDMSFVDHIEFVKGPAGFMLSNGDPSGLYNVVTKKPTGISRGEVSLSAGSFDFFRASLDLDGKLSEDGKLLYRLNLAAQNRKSHRANEYNNRYVIAPVVAWQIDDRTRITAEYIYQRANMSDVGSYYIFSTEGFAVYPREFTSLPAGMPGTTINDHNFFVNLDHKISSAWRITAQLARLDYSQSGSSMWPGAVNPDGTMIRAVSSWDAKSAMTMAQVFVNGEATTGNIRHRVLAGIDIANKAYFADWGQYHQLDSVGAEFDSRNPYYGTPVNGYPKFDFSTPIEQRAQTTGGLLDQRYSGVYIQDELGFMQNRLRITLAGRYTSVTQSEYGGKPMEASRFTPRVGVSASLTRHTSLYALYDQAFIPQGGQLTSGEAVKPITGSNREIGLKRDWLQGRWSTTLAVYSILKQHELTADPNADPNSGLSIELGEKTAKGIELDVRGTIFNGFHAVANYALTDSRVTKVDDRVTDIEEGDIVPGYARHTSNAWLTYQLPAGALKGTGFSLGFTYLADRRTYWDESPDPSKSLPDYFKLDGGIFWERGDFRVTANIFNILDSYLYSGSYYQWLNAYYWQADPPRNLRLSVNYSF